MKIINLIRYLLEFVIIITFFFLFKILGLKLSSFISGKIFTFLGPLFRSKKMFAKNFKIAFPNTPEHTTKKYFNEMWNYYGRIFAEYPFLFKFRKDEIKILYDLLKTIESLNKKVDSKLDFFDDFQKYGSFEKAKENGKLRLEGKDYLVKDGDVLFFRVNP